MSCTIRSAIADALKKANRPMHYREITRHVRASGSGLGSRGGETPEQTVKTILLTDPLFRRVGSGMYDLARKPVAVKARLSSSAIWTAFRELLERCTAPDISLRIDDIRVASSDDHQWWLKQLELSGEAEMGQWEYGLRPAIREILSAAHADTIEFSEGFSNSPS